MTAKRFAIVTGTVITAVLFALILTGETMYEPRSDTEPYFTEPSVSAAVVLPDSPAGDEMRRILNVELSAAAARNEMNFNEYLAEGGNAADYVSADAEIEIEILGETETAVSFLICVNEDDGSVYGRTRYYNLDPDTGIHLTLEDVLGENYRGIVWKGIMSAINDAPSLRDRLRGEEELAPLINRDWMFYVTDDGVTVVFDVGEAADEELGMVEITVIQ